MTSDGSEREERFNVMSNTLEEMRDWQWRHGIDSRDEKQDTESLMIQISLLLGTVGLVFPLILPELLPLNEDVILWVLFCFSISVIFGVKRFYWSPKQKRQKLELIGGS